jgi:hypothetical protein
VSPVVEERRSAQRFREAGAHGIATVRVRPGHHADLLDVSEGGALVETTCRLLPGASVELQMETRSGKTSIRGRVVRCDVSKLFPASVWYRGAVQFDRHLPWYAGEHGYGLPGVERSGRPETRVAATHEAI